MAKTLTFSLMEKARTQMLFKQPFFASLAMRLTLVEDTTCKTAWTDGKRLGYNPSFVEKLTPGQRVTLWVHEVMHPALLHHIRRGVREPLRWNMAGDYMINAIVKANGLEWIPGILFDEQYKDDSSESCYQKLAPQDEQQKPQPQPGDGDEGGEKREGQGQAGDGEEQGDAGGQGKDDSWQIGEVRDATTDTGGQMGEAERVEAERDQKVAIDMAEKAAKSRGIMPAGVEFLLESIREPKADWRTLLQQWVQRLAADDYTMARINRRYVAHNIYVPGLHSDAVPENLFAIDTSGSCFDNETQAQFLGELSGALAAYAEISTHVVYFDTEVYEGCEELITKLDLPLECSKKLKPQGGGGTSFEPIFEWTEEKGIQPAFAVVLTDLYGSYPKEAPPYPVLWVSTAKANPGDHWYPKFGDVIFIND